MGVTAYLFDANRRIRRVLPDMTELLHTESDGTLEAVLPQTAGASPGEELGFTCVDGLFRLFTIDSVEHDDHDGTAIVAATDAARAELQDSVVLNVEQESAMAVDAARQMLDGRGWSVEGGGGRSEKVATGYTSAWAALSELESTHEVRVLPGYTVSGGAVTGKRIVIAERTGTFRGRIFEARLDATDIAITHSKRPITRAYGVGAATGTQDVPTRLTIADAAWSRANGDPADKPAGQAYIDNPDAPPGALVREMMVLDENETDAAKLLEKTWKKLRARQTAHVSGTATVSDVEMQPGMSYKAVRLYDRVAVVARSGERVMATVLEIKRDYVRPHLTKITIGEEDFQPRTLSKTVATLARSESASRGRSAGASNKIIQNAALIQLNAEAIQMNAKTILAQAEDIKLRATKEEVEQQGKKLNAVSIDLNAAKATLELKASQSDLQKTQDGLAETTRRVSKTEIDLDGALAQIRLKADLTVTEGLAQRISSAEVTLDGANAQIRQIAQVTDDQGNRISSAEITLDGAKSEIALRAKQIDLDALITKVNGLTTGGVKAKSLYTEKLIVTNNYLHIGDKDGTWKTYTAVTDFTQASGESAPAADVTVFAASISDGAARTPEAGETVVFSGAA